jgi:hypothetical protein
VCFWVVAFLGGVLGVCFKDILKIILFVIVLMLIMGSAQAEWNLVLNLRFTGYHCDLVLGVSWLLNGTSG